MADYDQNVSAINKVQKWKEYVTGYFARLNGAVLYGISTGSAEQALETSTAGVLRVQPAGSTWVTLLASTARSTSPVSTAQTNIGYKAHVLQVMYETATGAGITPSLQIKEPLSSDYMTIWTAATTIASTGHYSYLFDLGGAGSAGDYTEAVNIRLGYQWRLNVTQSSSGATTYTATMDLLV